MSINDVVNNGNASRGKKYSKNDMVFWRMAFIFAVLAAYTVFELYAHGNGVNIILANAVAVWGSLLFAAGAVVCFVLSGHSGLYSSQIIRFNKASTIMEARDANGSSSH